MKGSKIRLLVQYWGPLSLMCAVTLYSNQGTVAVPLQPVMGADKLAHLAVFGLIATSLYRKLEKQIPSWRAMLFSICLTALFGMSDELHQSMVPHRTFDMYDWLADLLGAAIAVVVYRCWPLYRSVLEWSPRRLSTRP